MPQETEELHLLNEWRVPGEERRTLSAGVLSLLMHVVVIVVLISLPKSAFEVPVHHELRRIFMPLVAPPRELTQTAPNKGKIGHEFTLENLMPRPPVEARTTSPSSTQPAARVPAPQAPVIPLPQIQAAAPAQTAQTAALGSTPNAPPPPPPATETPKLAFEKPGSSMGTSSGTGAGAVPRPPTVQDMIHGASPGSARGGIVVGDLGEGIGGLGTSPNLPPSPPKMGSNLEMLSDPQGVDFRPYLIRVLAAVRRNWLAVIPEAARLGQRGKVVVQFAIRRDGRVAKVVFAMEAGPGAQSLDRAAVASISASDPFPPLPDEFRGETVRLQLAFLYNTPTR